MITGLVLFAHGARDPRWREPFERLACMVSERHTGPVSLAFLESMTPSLSEAAIALARGGAARIVVVPLFLGTGGHIRRDLPVLIQEAEKAAGIPVTSATPAGEDEAVLEAIARYCLSSVP